MSLLDLLSDSSVTKNVREFMSWPTHTQNLCIAIQKVVGSPADSKSPMRVVKPARKVRQQKGRKNYSPSDRALMASLFRGITDNGSVVCEGKLVHSKVAVFRRLADRFGVSRNAVSSQYFLWLKNRDKYALSLRSEGIRPVSEIIDLGHAKAKAKAAKAKAAKAKKAVKTAKASQPLAVLESFRT
jgi:hypothetical protein